LTDHRPAVDPVGDPGGKDCDGTITEGCFREGEADTGIWSGHIAPVCGLNQEGVDLRQARVWPVHQGRQGHEGHQGHQGSEACREGQEGSSRRRNSGGPQNHPGIKQSIPYHHSPIATSQENGEADSEEVNQQQQGP
jgi:hypothetical protein